MLITWTLSIVNALQHHGVFSPNQLIFGYNIANSLVITDRTLVLTLVISSDIISDHLNAIHSVKKKKRFNKHRHIK